MPTDSAAPTDPVVAVDPLAPVDPAVAGALDPGAVVGLLAEPARLRVVAALVLGAATLAEVATAGGVALPDALRALDRLVSGGLVAAGPGTPTTYRLRDERLAATAREVAGSRPRGVADEGLSDDQREVLRNFVVDGRLTAIPAVRGKRRVVLDYLAGRFEPGRIYPERDVNFMLGTVHPDYAALRRYLVDDGFLERRDGFYWRAGGTFDVD